MRCRPIISVLHATPLVCRAGGRLDAVSWALMAAPLHSIADLHPMPLFDVCTLELW
jgi:hypothetical protein